MNGVGIHVAVIKKKILSPSTEVFKLMRCIIIYSEKQSKDVKFLLKILHLRNNFQTKYSVSDRNTSLQFSKINNKIYSSLVTIQYYAKCNNPF